MVQRRVELVDGVRPERVAYLGPVKSDPDDGGVDGPVIGDVGEVEAIHRMPQLRRERASHALKLAAALVLISAIGIRDGHRDAPSNHRIDGDAVQRDICARSERTKRQ